ncbi:MAG: nucleotide exchange factor GrpE [Acidobacteria bacterium]|nr:nucleotide exchange factor GrpE [Acidobacteriota bacterium]
MGKSRPENDDRAGDSRSVSSESGTGGEDSIEILEVVGMDPESPVEKESEAPTLAAEAEEKSGDSIPYSKRELYDILLRQQAEFENARKRLEREKQETQQRISMDLLRRFLPILDNFHRALDEASSPAEDSFRRGVALTVQQMQELLRREGLEEIEATGQPFDPHLHEAVETQQVEGMEEGIVLEDLRKGYRFQGQLLRPSLVRVSTQGGRRREGDA